MLIGLVVECGTADCSRGLARSGRRRRRRLYLRLGLGLHGRSRRCARGRLLRGNLTRLPALETANAVGQHFTLAHAHLADGLRAQVDTLAIAFGIDGGRLLLVVGGAAVILGGVARQHFLHGLVAEPAFEQLDLRHPAGFIAFENRVAPLVKIDHALVAPLRRFQRLLAGTRIGYRLVRAAGEFKLEVARIVVAPRDAAA